MAGKLRLGVIGAGNMAQTAHLPCFAMLPEVELAALYTPRKAVAEAVCRRWSIPVCVESEEQLLARDLDAVAVLSPVGAHRKSILAALAAGRDVFTEKPLAMAADTAREIAAAADKAGRKVVVGYMKRHDANVAAAQRRIASGEFGRLLFCRAHAFIGSGWDASIGAIVPVARDGERIASPPEDMDPGPRWMDTPRDAKFYSFDNPYYGWLDTGSHTVNLLRYLAGVTPSVTSAVNRGGARLATFDVAGAPGTLEFCVNFQMARWDEVTELYFEKGVVRVATPPPLAMQRSAEVSIYTEAEGRPQLLTLEETPEWQFLRQAKAFVETVRTRAAGPCEAGDSVMDLELVEAIYRKETNQ